MLDAFIIEELKRRERLRQERERPALDAPLPEAEPPTHRKGERGDEDAPGRGVVVIDLRA